MMKIWYPEPDVGVCLSTWTSVGFDAWFLGHGLELGLYLICITITLCMSRQIGQNKPPNGHCVLCYFIPFPMMKISNLVNLISFSTFLISSVSSECILNAVSYLMRFDMASSFKVSKWLTFLALESLADLLLFFISDIFFRYKIHDDSQ